MWMWHLRRMIWYGRCQSDGSQLLRSGDEVTLLWGLPDAPREVAEGYLDRLADRVQG